MSSWSSGPKEMSDQERFAVDQFLMRGGSLLVATGNYRLSPFQFGGGLTIEEVKDGLREMLADYGVEIGQELVMDPQNEPFPAAVCAPK